VETSILARFGRFLAPLGSPLGLDWKVLTALLTSIVAKENVVATLGVLYGVGDEGLVNVLPTVLSRASALSLLTGSCLRSVRGHGRRMKRMGNRAGSRRTRRRSPSLSAGEFSPTASP